LSNHQREIWNPIPTHIITKPSTVANKMNSSSRSLLSLLLVAVVAFVCVAGTGQRLSQRFTQRGLKSVDAPASTADQTASAMDEFESALSAALAVKVNEAANVSWTAGMNDYFEEKSYQFLKQSCGTKIDLAKVGTPGTATQAPTWYEDPNVIASPQPAMAAFPIDYDARQQWGEKCPSLHDIRDQAGCGSCWAVAAASSMTDRHCIASQGARRPYLSAHNILTCCGHELCGSCQGGYPINAWQFGQHWCRHWWPFWFGRHLSTVRVGAMRAPHERYSSKVHGTEHDTSVLELMRIGH
jgi:hypothetical protein